MSFFELPEDPEERAKFFETIQRIEIEKEAHYAAIGRVASDWAYFEHEMNSQSERLGKIPTLPGLCLMANIMGVNKLDSYIAMAEVLGTSSKGMQALNAFKRDARGLSEQRNRVVHDPWLLISPKERAMRLELTARGKLRAGLVPMPTAEVLKLSGHIRALTDRFVVLANQILDEMPAPSPETSPPR